MAVENHLDQTKTHVARLEEAFDYLDEQAMRKACAGMRGLIEEGDEHAREDYGEDGLRDAVIIGGAQRIEHYEIAAYGTALAHARLLLLDDVADLLEATLAEEKEADERLTEIAEEVVNLDAAGEDEDDEIDEQPRSATTQAPAERSRR